MPRDGDIPNLGDENTSSLSRSPVGLRPSGPTTHDRRPHRQMAFDRNRTWMTKRCTPPKKRRRKRSSLRLSHPGGEIKTSRACITSGSLTDGNVIVYRIMGSPYSYTKPHSLQPAGYTIQSTNLTPSNQLEVQS